MTITQEAALRPMGRGGVFSLFKQLVLLLLGGRDSPERAKKRALKRIAKALTANAYGKFFRVKSVQVTPELAEFFYGLYKLVFPARTLLQNAAQSTQLKLDTVESFLDAAQQEALEKLSAESIAQRAEETEENLLARQLQSEFAGLERSFDAGRSSAVNECYRLILRVCEFVEYDYYLLLKKFDCQLTERNFSRKPVFNALRGEAVTEELTDFLALTCGMDPNQDWTGPLRILEQFMGTEAISVKVWSAMLFTIREMVDSKICELMIRFVEKNPDWSWKPQAAHENIAGWYLETIRLEISDRLALVLATKRNALIEQHAKAVFGIVRVSQLNYYTEQGSEVYSNKKFAGFTEARALEYLMLFLNDEKPELKNLYELILIRGQWTSMKLSFPLSESLWLLELFPVRILELDEMLADWGFYGSKLKTAILNLARDKSAERSIARNLHAVNREARQIVNEVIFYLSILHDGLKDLKEDCRRTPGLIIRNWEELNSFSETALENRLAALWKKLTNMLELLRALTQITNDKN
jgi:hypothetical protein